MNSILKQTIKKYLYRPRCKEIGSNSWVMLPRWLYNPSRIRIGSDCVIGRFATLHPINSYGDMHHNGIIAIGNNVYIGGYVHIHSMGSVEISDGCVLSEHVYISDIAHGLNPTKGAIMDQPLESKGPVCIGRNVFIGLGCSILPGVTLGDHCVVGTRSVVTHSFPSYSMIAGAPAKLVKVFDQISKEWVKPKTDQMVCNE